MAYVDENDCTEPHSKQRRRTTDDESCDSDDNGNGNNDSVGSKPFSSINKAGRPAEAGIILRVYLENFMCHRKRTVALCPNVNFINGQNGSGKSAILAAVQICLGAGAKRTHRARNLKELIRKEAGSSSQGAKVRVTLLNTGDDAFEHDLYGDSITVERCISHRGYNGYRLLDYNGKERSKLKKDLDNMLDQLNIQVENPVAVLDQEEAKKFLTGKPEDKYAFFTKATELERLDRSYAITSDNMEETRQAAEEYRIQIEPAKEKCDELKKQYKDYQELQKIEDKLGELRILCAWSFYHTKNGEVKSQQVELDKLSSKQSKCQSEIEKISSSNDNTEEQEELQSKLEQLSEEAQAATGAKLNLQDRLKEARIPIKKKKHFLGSLQKDLHVAKRSNNSAVKELKKARDTILEKAGSAESEEAKRVEKLKSTEDKLAQAKTDYETQRQKIDDLYVYIGFDDHFVLVVLKNRHKEFETYFNKRRLYFFPFFKYLANSP